MIVKALRDAARPISAYEIIDSLRDRVALAPQTVYRSLDRLIASGAAHRLETLNAFVACTHKTHKSPTGAAMFAICRSCGGVTEFADADVEKRLTDWSEKQKFRLDGMTLELRGTCASCAERPRAAQSLPDR